MLYLKRYGLEVKSEFSEGTDWQAQRGSLLSRVGKDHRVTVHHAGLPKPQAPPTTVTWGKEKNDTWGCEREDKWPFQEATWPTP